MNKIKNFIKNNLVLVIMFPLGVIADQLSKFFATKYLVGKYITIIPKLFGFTYTLNEGAAWGSLSGQRILLSLISLFACVFVLIYYFKGRHKKITKVALSMVFTGAFGNMIDRITTGKVIDFIDFNIFVIFYDQFPIFNIADMFVTFGAILLLICIIFIEKEDLNG